MCFMYSLICISEAQAFDLAHKVDAPRIVPGHVTRNEKIRYSINRCARAHSAAHSDCLTACPSSGNISTYYSCCAVVYNKLTTLTNK